MTKTKLLSLLLAAALIFSAFLVLTACGEQPNDPSGEHTCADPNRDGLCDICGKKIGDNGKHVHTDANADGKCDECGQDMDSDDFEDTIWDTTDLIMKLTKNSNGQELPSGCERYMAGEDDRMTESIDDMVRERNADAEKYANVKVIYDYYPDATGYGWNANCETIYTEVMSRGDEIPDIFVNFMTDMVNTSLKGSFANLYSTSRGTGDLRGYNDFAFTQPDYDETVEGIGYGYMFEYMKWTTLSKFKMYIVASDYFLDLVRAFLIVPVNVKLLNSVIESTTGDYNDDGEFDIDDFYAMIEDGKWTYATVADYCSKIYQAGADNAGTAALTDEQVGLAISRTNGLPSTGFLFTSSVIIIKREWSDTRADYDYWYPEENEDLINFCDALCTLFESTGVITVGEAEYTQYGTNSMTSIRSRFANNHVLFGNINTVGALEYDEYQNMKNGIGISDEDRENANFGFGIAPVPLYREGDRYLTLITTIGKGGGIASTTTKFAQCTRYLDYQSTHSSDILNEYYDYKLQYDVAGGTKGNVAILTYIRHNVRSAFDKVFEDAIGTFFKSSDSTAMSNRWNALLNGADYKIKNVRDKYAELYPIKAQRLETLIKEYDKLPD